MTAEVTPVADVAALQIEYRQIAADVQARRVALNEELAPLVERSSQIERAVDDALLMAREAVPSAAHLEGIANAAEALREGRASRDHLGDACGPEGDRGLVVVEASMPRISIKDGSPLSLRSGTRLWRFSGYDIEALEAAIVAQGVVVVEHWSFDGGVSFRVSRKGLS